MKTELNRASKYGDKGLWFRKVYHELLRNRTMTAAVRPGDRSNPKSLNYILPGEPVPVRIIKVSGNQAAGIPALLEPDEGITVEITGYIVKSICTLMSQDLAGCSPDASTRELVRWHLGLMYDRASFDHAELVTVWHWRYVEP